MKRRGFFAAVAGVVFAAVVGASELGLVAEEAEPTWNDAIERHFERMRAFRAQGKQRSTHVAEENEWLMANIRKLGP